MRTIEGRWVRGWWRGGEVGGPRALAAPGRQLPPPPNRKRHQSGVLQGNTTTQRDERM